MSRQKVPAPGGALVLDDEHVTTWSDALWRIHRTAGRHPSRWNELRAAGPLDGMRWEPQQKDSAPAHGLRPSVAYTATTVYGTFAEVFHEDRAIQLAPGRALSAWVPTRELQLVDLSESDFAVHNGAAHVLPSLEDKSMTRQWAQAIFEQFGDQVDGLLHDSTILRDKVAVLFTRAQNSYPVAPKFSRALDHVEVARFAADVGQRLHWPVL